jgi:hypothetical protein
LSFGERFATLHRGGRKFGLRLVAADDEHQQVLLARLVVGDVHEAARDAHREGDDVVGIQIGVFHRLALVPLATPAPGHWDKRFVGVVVVHQRALAGLRFAIAEVEAFGDRDRWHRGGIVAYRRRCRRARAVHRRLETDDCIELSLAFGERAVGQASIGAFQVSEARHALHHLFTSPVADLSPVAHTSSDCGML